MPSDARHRQKVSPLRVLEVDDRVRASSSRLLSQRTLQYIDVSVLHVRVRSALNQHRHTEHTLLAKENTLEKVPRKTRNHALANLALKHEDKLFAGASKAWERGGGCFDNSPTLTREAV